MTMSSVQNITKGDIIVERISGKNRMIPIRKVEFNACSSKGVHVNTSMCYDHNAVVQLVDSDGTITDLESALDDLEEDFDPGLDVTVGDVLEAMADRLVKH